MDSNYTEINLGAVNRIRDILLLQHQTAAVAESVTAGDIQSALSLAEGALSFFQGGITVYNLGQKARHLHIDPIHALDNNCVSERVAAEMAVSVTSLFSADWGISVTGYASLLPNKNINELYACFAISYRSNIVRQETVYAQKAPPRNVRFFYTNNILSAFLKQIR